MMVVECVVEMMEAFMNTDGDWCFEINEKYAFGQNATAIVKRTRAEAEAAQAEMEANHET